MLGKLQQKKITRLFGALDKNKDGLLEEEDFAALASRLAAARKVDVNSPLYKEMHAAQMRWWENIRIAANKDINGRVTLAEWISFWSGWLTTIADEAGASQQTALDAMKKSATATFDMIDADRDGRITPGEYEAWSRVFALNFDARANFRRLDLNQDGVLTREEVVGLLKEFFLTNDPEASGNHLYGPLF
jgi:Ca2+-binding EF-hand superfamily protein